MTLIKKMALGILFMLFIVFIGTYVITMNNARNFFIDQIESNAQDTATSLGLSISQSLVNHDLPSMKAMTQAIFDRGYFSSIQVKDVKGKVIVNRTKLAQESNIPKWFVNLISWPSTEKSSLVMNGWMQAGEVEVTSDPSYAYASLWVNAVGMVKAYLMFAFIALVLAYAFIQFILKPLKRVTQQAQAISDHEFPIETNIPKTPELRQVTLAMNRMVVKIKSLFQEQLQQADTLRVQVYQDQLTGLSNRRYFLQQLTSILDSEDDFIPGYVLMVVVDGLDELNQHQGYQKGDNLVLAIARTCKDYWKQSSVATLARINGSTFAIIVHERDPQLFEKQCKEFEQHLKQAIPENTHCKTHMGAVGYFAHQSVSNLLTMVDLAVKKARETGVFYCQKEHDTFKYPKVMTMDEIKQAMEHQRVSLYAQAVTNGTENLHKELFVRLQDEQGEELGAGYFMPIAEKYAVAYLIDLYVLQQLLNTSHAKNGHFALNISPNTINNAEHREAYITELKSLPKEVIKRLSFEVDEAQVLNHFDAVKSFIKQVKKLGASVGIDRAGTHFSPMQYLSDLQIDYVKLHGSLIQDIDENESKQYFIHYFNEMAKTLDIQVVATQVEQEVQWKTLQAIPLPWGQGRYLGIVEALK